MAAISEETMIKKSDLTLQSSRGEELYKRFCMVREMNAKANYEEDVKMRDLFFKLGREQAEKAEAELYNKESEGELLGNVVNGYEELEKKAEELKNELKTFRDEISK